MQAMILAAGLGSRMRPLTDTLPKPLLAVHGEPLIAHHLRALAAAGVTHVVINLAYRGAQIREYVGRGRAWGLQVSYSEEPEPLETGGAIVNAAKLLGSDPFILVNADVYTGFDFALLVARGLSDTSAGHLVLVDNPSFKAGGDFDLAANGTIQTLRASASGYTFAGISLLRPSLVLEYPHRRRKFALAEVFRAALAQRALTGEIYTGLWSDVGTPERLAALNR